MSRIEKDNILFLLGEKIPPGKRVQINFNTAKLYTQTSVEIPVIIERAKQPGPIVLLTAGIHGDEINGVEIVRQIIAHGINKPRIGTIICIPLLNVFGFLDMKREFPGGRDLNRVFPGAKKGSLASMFAHQFVHEILPVVDFCLDFHTGGASRYNVPQIRVAKGQEKLLKYAHIFNAPFTVLSNTISKSYRKTCEKLGKPILLFEGGKSLDIAEEVTLIGIEGTKRILKEMQMLPSNIELKKEKESSILIEKTKWMRARHSGLLHVKTPSGVWVEKGSVLAYITDPYGKFSYMVKANNKGYIININQSPIVYQGDAIFHISEQA